MNSGMSKFKAFSVLYLEEGQVDGLHRIVNGRGEVVIAGAFRSAEEAQRLVDCWNACRKVYSPAAHIEATNEYVERIEKLRKEAWSRAVELGANDFRAPGENFYDL